MNALNFFKFLQDKKGIRVPGKVRLLDPDYVIDVEDFEDKNGNVILNYMPVTSLPDNLTVKRRLSLASTSIKSLPNNLTVGGDLNLLEQGEFIEVFVDTPIEVLPNNLTVRRDLILNYTKVNSLPADLKVGGDLLLGPTTPLAQYNEFEIRQMAPGIKGDIWYN